MMAIQLGCRAQNGPGETRSAGRSRSASDCLPFVQLLH